MTRSPTVTRDLRRVVQLQAMLLALLTLIATLSVLTYRSADTRARRTADVLVTLGALRADVLSAETGLRGFVLVDAQEFLDPYREAFPGIEESLALLEDRTDGGGRMHVARIAATIDAWRTDFAEVILEDLAAGRRTSAFVLIESGAGKDRLDSVRSDIDALETRTRAQLDERRRTADRLGAMGLLLGIAALLVLVSTAFASRRRLRHTVATPLIELAAVADRFGHGDLTARVDPTGVDEVRQLGSAFNAMADRTEATVSELRTVDRLKSEFVSVVSHELRTPLTSIRGSLGLIASGAMGELPPDAAGMLSIAVSNTDRLVRLINDILDLARIESGESALDVRPCNAADVMRDAVHSVGGAAEAAGVAIELTPLDAGLHADPDRIVQALTNLLANAIKFSDRGARVVLTGERREHEVALHVRDEGRGIPEDLFDDIFDRFGQVDASDAREKGGTGLGLAIVRSIAERHGGRVELRSTVGQGSTFTLVLPSPVPTATGIPPTKDVSAVVLVEDDVDLQEIIRTRLNHHGIGVDTAATATEAIERCRETRPNVLILDLRLQEGSGYEVVRALRQDDRLRSLATVVYTVSDLTEAQRDALRLGDTVFLTKGLKSNEDLEREVLDLLGRVGGR